MRKFDLLSHLRRNLNGIGKTQLICYGSVGKSFVFKFEFDTCLKHCLKLVANLHAWVLGVLNSIYVWSMDIIIYLF